MERGPEPLVQLVAMRALERIDKASAAKLLQPLLADADLDVRMTAAVLSAESSGALRRDVLASNVRTALGGDGEWAGWLERAMKGPEPSAEAVSLLESRMRAPSKRDRATAAWMIAAALGPDSRMVDLLRDGEPNVVISAIHALAPFLTAAALETLAAREGAEDDLRHRLVMLQNVALRLRSEDVDVRRAAALVLADAGRTDQALLFVRALKDGDWFVRFAALKGIERVAHKAVAAVFREARPRTGNEWERRVLDRINAKGEGRGP